MFSLLVNYRSHRGVTNLAAELIDIMVHFFPATIDSLGREVGITDGILPIIFDAAEHPELDLRSSLKGVDNKEQEFGAEQCIIVRDDKARDAVRAQLGADMGLILTVYESKGERSCLFYLA
jgi:hypothetical protein